jgi:hypothetical protein
MAKKKSKKSKGGKGCVSKAVATKGKGKLKKGYKYGKGGCIRRSKKSK